MSTNKEASVDENVILREENNNELLNKIDGYIGYDDILKKLYNISKVLTYYTVDEFFIYFKNRKDVIIIQYKGKITYLSEIIANIPTVCKFLNDSFYSEILCDYFMKFNNITLQDNRSMISWDVYKMGDDYTFLDDIITLLDTGRIIRLVSQKMIEPFLFRSIQFPLSKSTFTFYIHQITKMPEIFNLENFIRYKLNYDEWIIMLKVVKSSKRLFKKIVKELNNYISCNSNKSHLINVNILLAICNINYQNNIIDTNYKEISLLTCLKHNYSIRPFDTFFSIGELTNFDTYLIYLRSKISSNNYSEDLSGFTIEVFNENCSNIKNDIIGGEIYKVFEIPTIRSSSQCNTLSVSAHPLLPSSSQVNEFDLYLKKHYSYQNPKEIIMDILLQCDYVNFNYHLFSYFINFHSKHYYENVLKIFGIKIIEANIKPNKEIPLFTNLIILYNFLHQSPVDVNESFSDYSINLDDIAEFTDYESKSGNLISSNSSYKHQSQLLPLLHIHSYICFTAEEKLTIINQYKIDYTEDELIEYKIIKTGNTILTQKCTDFNQLIYANIYSASDLDDLLKSHQNNLITVYDFEDIGEALKKVCTSHIGSSKVISRIQDYIITFINHLNIKENDFFLLEEMFEILIKVKNVKCRQKNEIIFRKCIRLAKLMGKDIVIGNIK